MASSTLEDNVDIVVKFIKQNLQSGVRYLIGIAGPPASGKTTLAEAVVDRFNQNQIGSVPNSSLVPMDGYHLDNSLLEARGLLARKGAPETFDAEGFCSSVKQLANANTEAFHPKFDRTRDLAVANAIRIDPGTQIIVVEGNYLLLETSPWDALKDTFSSTIFLKPSKCLLEQRLYQRWLHYGLTPDMARERVLQNDMVNAELVYARSRLADLYLH